MSATHRHVFGSKAEADAFTAGVEYVNDSAVEVTGTEAGDDDDGPFVTVVCGDDDALVDRVTDYRVEGDDAVAEGRA